MADYLSREEKLEQITAEKNNPVKRAAVKRSKAETLFRDELNARGTVFNRNIAGDLISPGSTSPDSVRGSVFNRGEDGQLIPDPVNDFKNNVFTDRLKRFDSATDRTPGQIIEDSIISFGGQGVPAVAQGLYNVADTASSILTGGENTLEGTFGFNEDFERLHQKAESLKSSQLRESKRRFDINTEIQDQESENLRLQQIADGEDSTTASLLRQGRGFRDAAVNYVSNPEILADAVAETLPQLYGAGAAAKLSRSLVTEGMTKEQAAKFLKSKAGEKASRKAGTRGVITYTGLTEGASAGQSINQRIMEMSPELMYQQSPVMQDLVDNQGMGLTEAQDKIARDAQLKVAFIVGPTAALLNKVTGAANFESETLLSVLGMSKKGVVGIAGEFFEEAGTGAVQTAASNLAIQENVDPIQELLTDTGRAAGEGGVIGLGAAVSSRPTTTAAVLAKGTAKLTAKAAIKAPGVAISIPGATLKTYRGIRNIFKGGKDQFKEEIKKDKEIQKALKQKSDKGLKDPLTKMAFYSYEENVPNEDASQEELITHRNKIAKTVIDVINERVELLDKENLSKKPLKPEEQRRTKQLEKAQEYGQTVLNAYDLKQEKSDNKKYGTVQEEIQKLTKNSKRSKETDRILFRSHEKIITDPESLTKEDAQVLVDNPLSSGELKQQAQLRINTLKAEEAISTVTEEGKDIDSVSRAIKYGDISDVGYLQHRINILEALRIGDAGSITRGLKAFNNFRQGHLDKEAIIRKGWDIWSDPKNSLKEREAAAAEVFEKTANERTEGFKLQGGSLKVLKWIEKENRAIESVYTETANAVKNGIPVKESETESEAKAETEANSEEVVTEPEVKVEPVTEVKPEAEAEAEAETKTETEEEVTLTPVAAKPNTNAKPIVIPSESESESESETEPEPEPEVKAKSKPEPKSESKNDPKKINEKVKSSFFDAIIKKLKIPRHKKEEFSKKVGLVKKQIIDPKQTVTKTKSRINAFVSGMAHTLRDLQAAPAKASDPDFKNGVNLIDSMGMRGANKEEKFLTYDKVPGQTQPKISEDTLDTRKLLLTDKKIVNGNTINDYLEPTKQKEIDSEDDYAVYLDSSDPHSIIQTQENVPEFLKQVKEYYDNFDDESPEFSPNSDIIPEHLKKLSDEQVQGLGMLSEFMDNFKKQFIENVFSPKTSNVFVPENPIEYFTNSDGTFDDAFISGLSTVAFEYMANRAPGTVYNNPEAINKILHNKEEAALNEGVEELFSEAGSLQTPLHTQLGKNVLKALGLNERKTSPVNFKKNLQTNIGSAIVGTLEKMDLIDINFMPTEEFEKHVNSSVATKNRSSDTNFVRVRTQEETRQSDITDKEYTVTVIGDVPKAISESNQNSDGLLRKLFNYSPSGIGAVFKKSLEMFPENIKGNNQKLTRAAQDALSTLNKVPHTFKSGVYEAWDKLPESLKLILEGYEEDLTKLHVSKRLSAQARNNQIERDYTALLNFREKAEKKGLNTPFYLTYNQVKNTRNHMDNLGITTQGSKLHNALLGPSAHEVTVDGSNIDKFKLAVIQGMGFKLNNRFLDFSDVFDSKILGDEKIMSAVKAVDYLRTGNEELLTQEHFKAIAAVKEGDSEKTLIFATLYALSEYLATPPGTSFTTTLPVEVDGVTNGVILLLTQISNGGNTESLETLLEKGGFFKESNHLGLIEWLADPKNRDSYEDITEITSALLSDQVNANEQNAAAKIATIRNVLGDFIDIDGFVTPVGRKFAKPPLMISNYGAALRTIVENLANHYIEKVYDKIIETENQEELDGLTDELDIAWNGIKYADRYEYEIQSAEINILKRNFKQTYGKALKEALNIRFEDVFKTNKQLNNAIQIVYHVYRNKIFTRIAEVKEEKNLKALTTNQLEEIKKELIKFAPSFGILHSDPSVKEEGLLVLGSRSVTSYQKKDRTNFNLKEPITKTNLNTGETTTPKSITSHTSSIVMDSPGVSGIPTGIQAIDSAIIIQIFDEAIVNVHDAYISNLNDADRIGVNLNRALFKSMEYSLPGEILRTYNSVLKDLTPYEKKELDKSISNDPAFELRDSNEDIIEVNDFTKSLNEMVDEIHIRKNLLLNKIKKGSVDGYAGNITTFYPSEYSGNLTSAELNKLIKEVNDYSTEGQVATEILELMNKGEHKKPHLEREAYREALLEMGRNSLGNADVWRRLVKDRDMKGHDKKKNSSSSSNKEPLIVKNNEKSIKKATDTLVKEFDKINEVKNEIDYAEAEKDTKPVTTKEIVEDTPRTKQTISSLALQDYENNPNKRKAYKRFQDKYAQINAEIKSILDGMNFNSYPLMGKQTVLKIIHEMRNEVEERHNVTYEDNSNKLFKDLIELSEEKLKRLRILQGKFANTEENFRSNKELSTPKSRAEHIKRKFKSSINDIDVSTFRARVTKTISKDTVLDIFDLLGQKDNAGNKEEDLEHQLYLKNLLQNVGHKILDPITLKLRDMGAESIGALTANSVYINAAVSNVAKTSDMSTQEIYTHELVHSLLASVMDSATWAKTELVKLFNEAERVLTWEDLMPDVIPPGSTYEAEKEGAQSRLKHIFENTEGHQYHEFMVMALTNRDFRKLLTDKVKMPKLKVANKTVFGLLTELANKAWSLVLSQINNTHNLNSGDRVTQLFNEMIGINNRKQNLVGMSLEIAEVASNFALKGIENFVLAPAATIVRSDLVQESTSRTVALTGRVITHTMDTEFGTTLRVFRLMLDRMAASERNIFSSVLGSLLGRTEDSGKYIDHARKTKHAVETLGFQASQMMTKNLHSHFLKEDGLTAEEDASITAVMLMPDLESILGTDERTEYDLDKVRKLLSDSAYLKKEITRLEGLLKKDHVTYYNYYRHQSRSLASYMINGFATAENTRRNAKFIASRDGLKKKGIGNVGLAEKYIETLTTLYALDKVNQDQKKLFVDLMDAEQKVDSVNNGITYMLAAHRSLKEQTKNDLFKHNEQNIIKGFIPEITNPDVSFRVDVESAEDELKLLGFSKGSKVNQHDLDQNQEELFFYIDRDGLRHRYQTSATQLNGNIVKGTLLRSDKYDMDSMNEFNKVFLKIQKDGALQNTPGYVEKRINLHPVYDIWGKVNDYRYEMEEVTKKHLLEKNYESTLLLGKMAATLKSKPAAKEKNEELVNILLDDYSEALVKNQAQDFVYIGPRNGYALDKQDTKDVSKYSEIWNLLPADMKSAFGRRYGWHQLLYKRRVVDGRVIDEGLMVRRNLIPLIFGQRKIGFSSLNPITDEFERANLNTSKKIVNEIALFLNKPIMRKTEKVTQEVARLVKDTIVIKTGTTLLNNIKSNNWLLWMKGLSFKELTYYQSEALQLTKEYVNDLQKLASLDLEIQHQTLKGSTARATAIAAKLEKKLENNPIHPLIEEGMFKTIVEDIDVKESKFTYKGKLDEFTDNYRNRIPKGIRDIGNQVFVTHETELYKFLKESTQYSDFISRVALHRYNMEQGKMSFQESIADIEETFINYDLLIHPALQYLDDMNGLMFIKYFMGSQKVIANVIKLAPSKMASLYGAEALFDANLHHVGQGLFPLAGPNINDPITAVIEAPHAALFRDTVETIEDLL